MSPCPMLRLAAPIVALWAAAACAAPFDVYYRPSDKAAWTFYGGRETRAAADAAAAELAKSTGFATKVFALGEPVGRAAAGPAVRESVTIGARDYVRRPGLGYAPGWYRHGGGWGGGWSGGWGGGWGGGGWGGGYGSHSGSSSHHHHSSHHHSHEHHSSSHHSGTHATAHPSHAAAHAGGRGGAAHHSSSHHSHSHSHSHSHHSHSHHGGHHR